MKLSELAADPRITSGDMPLYEKIEILAKFYEITEMVPPITIEFLRVFKTEAKQLADRAAELKKELAEYRSQPVMTADEVSMLMTLLHIAELIKDGSPLVEIQRAVDERIAYTYGDEELASQRLDLYEEQIAIPAREEAEHAETARESGD